MTHLLKITKKSCLKLFRKIAPHKPLSIKKLEEEEEDEEIAAEHCYKHSISDETPISKLQSSISADPLDPHKQAVHIYDTVTTPPEVPKSPSSNDSDDKRILQSLTSKLFLTADGYEFRRLQQFRNDIASEIVQCEQELNAREIIFEKVKFNKHVRYFRRTPSSLSLDNYASSENMFAADSMDDLQNSKQYACSNNNPSPITPLRVNNGTANLNKQSNHGKLPENFVIQHIPNYVPLNVVNLELKNAGRFQNVTISEQRDCFDKMMPVVKWDINGNSLDDDFYNDNSWDDFDRNWNHAHDKRVANFKLDTESQKSSFRSSSTTLETWLDEDLFGNSFNERRQLQLSLCRSKV